MGSRASLESEPFSVSTELRMNTPSAMAPNVVPVERPLPIIQGWVREGVRGWVTEWVKVELEGG